MRKTVLTIAALVALAAPCAAQPHDAPPAVASGGAQPGEPLICHYYYYDGSLLRRPICKTEHEWIRERIRQQADVMAFQLRALRTVEH